MRNSKVEELYDPEGWQTDLQQMGGRTGGLKGGASWVRHLAPGVRLDPLEDRFEVAFEDFVFHTLLFVFAAAKFTFYLHVVTFS
jgi:hypothetical protein